MSDTSKAKSKGFTLIELMVIAPLVILLIGGVVAAMIHTASEAVTVRAKNELTYSMQDALDRMESDIELSTRFLSTTDFDIDLVSPQGFDNATADFDNIKNDTSALLLLTPLTDKNPVDTTRRLVHYSTGSNGCANPTQIMTGIVAYFVKDGTLWRRTITPADYATAGCSVPWQQPSCQPGVSGSFCKTEDIKLLTDVAADSLQVNYYESAKSNTELAGATDSAATREARQTALDKASTVRAQIYISKQIAGREISQTLSMYSTKLSTYASGGTEQNPDEPEPAPETGPITLASDNFTGSNGSGWNSSKWAMGYNPSGSGYSATISSNRGRLVSGSGSDNSNYARISRRMVMSQVADVEIHATVELGSSRNYLYIWGRDNSTMNWGRGYGLYLSSYGFEFDCAGPGSCSNNLNYKWVSYSMSVGTMYDVRISMVGNRMRAKVWPTSGSEPSNWMIDELDSSNSSPDPGYVGVILESGSNDTSYIHEITVMEPQ